MVCKQVNGARKNREERSGGNDNSSLWKFYIFSFWRDGLSLFGVEIEQDRREEILTYMDNMGCNPKLTGYGYLAALISLYADNPGVSCYELFAIYADKLYGTRSKKTWYSLYRACRYALFSSVEAGGFTVFGFIKSGAMSLRESL